MVCHYTGYIEVFNCHATIRITATRLPERDSPWSEVPGKKGEFRWKRTQNKLRGASSGSQRTNRYLTVSCPPREGLIVSNDTRKGPIVRILHIRSQDRFPYRIQGSILDHVIL